ncbi:YdiU family protein [Paraglaciecola chathamensis]|uniref:protein adenylyltransferase SelO n=1 Tax=Paraglaciecola chathamensis TaxID=368405 RepID=UPI002700B9C4|nr:YdiU family protein [Paraglaciecola chathamensis]MDO6840791.1 YdiU family protein [Paraglaciecola chathamensis]
MNLDHSYATQLGDLGALTKPLSVANPQLIEVNHTLRETLQLPASWFTQSSIMSMLFGNTSSLTKHSFAQKYGGHQFGGWNPDLGDGRGLLLGEAKDQQGNPWDLHLKGAGPTPYSRFADGRAVLRSTLREYLASEALHHMGIPTSRALCLITSDEPVYREKQEKAAMMLRVSQSHIRFGHFEYFYHNGELDKLEKLFDYCFERHFSDCLQTESPHLAMLEKIVTDTATLIAKWQAFGFNHGVMNTDNMSIHGITFDFGPYAFLDDFDPKFVCNHSDNQGRYAFEQQPGIGLWNLNALAHAFTPYLSIEQIKSALSQYEPRLMAEFSQLMRQKLGLYENNHTTAELVNRWLDLVSQDKRDYHISFRLLCDIDEQGAHPKLVDHFIQREAAQSWLTQYQQAIRAQGTDTQERQAQMRKVNPAYVLRNYQAQLAIDAAEQGDFTHFRTLLQVLQQPFKSKPEYAEFAKPPPDWGKHMEISCSS